MGGGGGWIRLRYFNVFCMPPLFLYFEAFYFRSNLENLHFTNHVKNASEEIKKFKLPGIGEKNFIYMKILAFLK